MTLRDFFTVSLKITNEELLKELCSVSVFTKLKKGEHVVKRGQRQSSIAFLVEGICRGYYESVDGKEVTECFGCRCGMPAMACYDLDSPAETSLVAETDMTCVRVPIVTIKALLKQYTELVYVYNNLLVNSLEEHLKLKQILYKYDAMGRYQWFLDTYPGLIDIVSHKDIASFLGMTPVTLSRLRRNLRGGGVPYLRKRQQKNRNPQRAGVKTPVFLLEEGQALTWVNYRAGYMWHNKSIGKFDI